MFAYGGKKMMRMSFSLSMLAFSCSPKESSAMLVLLFEINKYFFNKEKANIMII
jgi:hypothetical protein